MLINNTFGFIFVHVPKSAGTTITNLLSRFTSACCDIEVGGSPMGEAIQPYFRKRFGLSKHSTACEIQRVVGDDIWESYFTFSLARNPYHRAYSAYKFLQRMRKETQLDALAVIDGYSSFRDFVHSDYFQSEGLDRILMPQLFWVRKNENETLIGVDYVGRVESIEQTLKQIAIRLPNLMTRLDHIEIPRLNGRSDRGNEDLQAFLEDRGTESIIFEKYQVDFETFGYSRINSSHSVAVRHCVKENECRQSVPSEKETTAICITGMHRSGTSMVTRLLNICGLNIGEKYDLMPPNKENPEGFWEHTRFVALNAQILSKLKGGWDFPPKLSPNWYRVRDLDSLRKEAITLIHNFGSHPCWGWKDPRNCLTIEFWKSIISELKVIICIRNPREVVQSLNKRGASSDAFGFNLWMKYSQFILSLMNPEQYIVTHYEAYFADPISELKRVIDFVGLSASEDRLREASATIQTSLWRNRARKNKLPKDVANLYKRFCEMAGPVFKKINEPEVLSALDGPAGTSVNQQHERAMELINTGKPDEGFIALQRIVEADPNQAFVRNDLGVLCMQRGMKEQALSHYVAATSLNPDNITFRKNLADFLYVEMGQAENAMAHYERISAAQPDDVESLLISSHICISLGRFEKAALLFKRVLQLEPGNPIATQALTTIRKSEFFTQAEKSSNKNGGGGKEVGGGGLPDLSLNRGTLSSEARETPANSETFNVGSQNVPGFTLSPLLDNCQNNLLEIHRVGSFDEYLQYAALTGSVNKKRRQIERELIREGESFAIDGTCAICNSKVNFIVDYFASSKNTSGQRVPNWRERLICPECGLINRCRAVIHFVQTLLPFSANTSIYIAEQTTPVYQWLLKHYPKITGSEFLGNEIPLGARRFDEIRNENLTALTFPDDSFDCVMSFDVFEHIPDYRKAFLECARVLKPGGLLMFSIPFDSNSRHTIIRAVQNSDGSVEHHLPPQYHGDPLNRKKGCLCYQVFGWDIIQDMDGMGYEGSAGYFYWSREFGYLGNNQAIFLATKKTVQKQPHSIVVKDRMSTTRKMPVSIVIPVFNNLPYTQKCLKAVEKNTPEGLYEVIIVDNASSDGTTDHLNSLRGPIRVITNSRNLGFTLACNQGARIARGDYILFLNNDTEPAPGWLEKLIEVAESDSQVGIVGSKLIYPDGRLQEAGGIIFSDGSGWNFGRFEDPDDPAFNYVREVDYVSGASLLIRHSLLKKLNYFDEQYSPGYYEDTDICFGARSLGYKVIYCPSSVVVHHEGVSSGNDLNQGMKKYQDVNRLKFVDKWKEALLNQHAPDPENVISASERGVKGNILIIDPFLPMFDRASGSLRLFSILSLIKKNGYHITFIARNGQRQEKYAITLREMGIEVYATDPDVLWRMGINVRARKIDLRQILQKRPYSIAYISFYSLALQYLPIIRKLSPQTRIIIDSVDIHYVRENRRAELTADVSLRQRSNITKRHELSIYSKADAVVTVTEQDWDHVKEFLPGKPHFVIPNIHTTEDLPVSIEGRKGLLFIGNFDHPPNADAVKFFVDEIYPYVKKRFPDITLTIVGNNPPKDVLALEQNGVTVTGYVESTGPYLRKARVSVAPLRYGAGMKGKIGEAMASGLPVVTTAIGAEGMGLVSGKTALISDSPREFAEHIISLCTSDALWNSLAVEGRRFIKENFSPEKIGHQLEKMLKQAISLVPIELSKEDIVSREKCRTGFVEGLVSIIILTFNQLKYTKECIESIQKNTPEPHEIIFVDNGSVDGTATWLKEIIKDHYNYKLIENKKNLGFSKGCNQGLQMATGEYLLLLNNDVVLPRGWLAGMLECLNSAPNIGIVGPMTNNISGPQKVPVAGYSSLDELDSYAKKFHQTNRHRKIFYRRIVGFCMLFKRQLVDEIGLLDEKFGTGNFEDDDYCLRAALEGYTNLIAGDVFIHHYGSRSFVGNHIDYAGSMHGNKRIYLRKWSARKTVERYGAKLLSLNCLEKATESYFQGRVDHATATMLQAIKHSPDEKALYFKLAEMMIDFHRYQETIELLDAIPPGVDDAAKFELLGVCEEALGRHEKADDLSTRALALNPFMPRAINVKGIIAFKIGKLNDAEDFFRKAIEYCPSFGESYTNLGTLKWTAGDPSGAMNLFERGFILSPTVADVVSAYHLAVADTGSFERAEPVFREAKSLHPQNRRIAFFLIAILIQQGKYAQAMHEIELAMIKFGIDDEILSAALNVRVKIGPQTVNPGGLNKNALSLCMIVKNEEQNLAKCLMSVKPLAEEMIVVDTGSTDRTKDIAKAIGAKVFDFKWNGDFSKARNFSLSKASGRWILVMDADEVISMNDQNDLRSLVESTNKTLIAYSIQTRNYTYHSNVLGWKANKSEYSEEEGMGWFPSTKVRLFPNDHRIRFENAVHELVEPSLQGLKIPIVHCPIPVHHFGKLQESKTHKKTENYAEIGRKKLKKNRHNTAALKEHAIQCAHLGHHREALSLWKKFVKLQPKSAEAFVNMGTACWNLGLYAEAISFADQALCLDRSMKEALYNKGIALLMVGRAGEAITILKSLLEEEPEYPAAQFMLCVSCACLGDSSKVEDELAKIQATPLGPFLGESFHDAAKRLLSASQIGYARRVLEAAVRFNYGNTEIMALLGDCRVAA